MSCEHRESSGPSHRLVQFTDPHIGGRPDYQLLGLDTGRTLDEVLRAIARDQAKAELMVATGDISANGSEAAYRRFLQKMQSVRTPWRWLPGNHDDPARMRQLAPRRSAEVANLGNWRLLLLDTSVENQICGGLSEEQLRRLQQLLEESREHPVMILMHHQPVPVGSDWIDGHMLREGCEQFLRLVRAAPHVKALVWGHVHQQFDGNLDHIGLHATPSTSVQFTPGSGPFSVDDEMPGYRWFDLKEDGTYTTGVERVTVSEYSVDLASAGY
ncbi:metallophosphoesterase [Microbulbifer thermotolerans]|uniref:Metallophosphoesterase n=1 Tax=Microbulbifer thermotolerans TaxID=252514 RepID=A0A143HQ15_MICTH|nr:metallophosphoesterase [Microbulbifer thermotolerans]AMX03510.1 phosphodiesterase [Microbulbifer thermotolerans]MCX2781089.1 metallophosphoesterase [Microbulbifer thermotolerans]MCX2782234.1 metallophosphoesterase [Microbulbifer thermotolerans]MCX2795326.1 metallophosphoesterase [Microbulbifer thermotolerans]MCX2801112.1 metallophosphoesterase [Microbulbifer thermotolerans]